MVLRLQWDDGGSMVYSKLKELVPVNISVKQRRDGDFIIAMNSKNELQYLNDTAAFIFEQIDGKRKIGQIFDNLIAEYNIHLSQKQEVENDLLSIIRDFQWQKLIKLMEVNANEEI